MPRKADPAGIAEQVLASPKYRHLDEALVRRMAAEAAGRFRDHNEAVKYAKRKLHQAFGAFLTGAKNTLILAAGGEFFGILLGLALVLLAISERAVVRDRLQRVVGRRAGRRSVPDLPARCPRPRPSPLSKSPAASHYLALRHHGNLPP